MNVVDTTQIEDAEVTEVKNLPAINRVSQGEIAKFDEFNNINEMLNFAQILIDSKLVPLKKPEAVVLVITQGKELGFKAVTAVNNIHVIEGRPTLSVHAIAALLKMSGVTYKITEDFVSVTENGEGHATRQEGVKYIDKRTTIEFYQAFHGELIKQSISFTWKEAELMGLTTKYNWKNMPKIMMRNRCLAIGARFVAPEKLLGLYEVSEWADVKDKNYRVTEEGEVVISD